MPGRTAPEAFQAFIEPLKFALACVARAQITTSPRGRGAVDTEHSWTINSGDGAEVGGGLRLKATMRYVILRTSATAQPFKVQTRKYLYAIEAPDRREILCAHWHPDSSSPVSDPHWHIGGAALTPDGVLTPRAHLPSGRISFEEVVLLAVDLGAQTLVEDWQARLQRTRQNYEDHRSWA